MADILTHLNVDGKDIHCSTGMSFFTFQIITKRITDLFNQAARNRPVEAQHDLAFGEILAKLVHVAAQLITHYTAPVLKARIVTSSRCGKSPLHAVNSRFSSSSCSS